MFLRGISYALTFVLCVAIVTNVRSTKVRQVTLLIASYALYVAWAGWFMAVLPGWLILSLFGGSLFYGLMLDIVKVAMLRRLRIDRR